VTEVPDLRPLVAEAYLGLADVLESSTEDDWDTPSLCEGWRVREVVAHVTMPSRYDPPTFMAELEARGFDFTRTSNELAARDGQLPTERLVGDLRLETLHRWTPPGGGLSGALNHAVVHGLDVTVPLGRPPVASDDALRVVLDDLTAGGGHRHFGTEIAGRRFVATDLDWSHGTGAVVRAPAAGLAFVLTGRRVAARPQDIVEGG